MSHERGNRLSIRGCARLTVKASTQPGRTPLPLSAFLNTVRDRAPDDLWIGLP
jgi:hypothetical protein